jgi:hypothetical protein
MLKLEQQITRKEQHTYTMVLSCSIPFTIVASSSTEALDDARDIVMNSKGSELPGFTIQVQGRVIEL